MRVIRRFPVVADNAPAAPCFTGLGTHICSPAMVRHCSPYQRGDVVYVATPLSYKRALILDVLAEFLNYSEHYVAKYRISMETVDGTWSKMFSYTYPGDIERGYSAAGCHESSSPAGESSYYTEYELTAFPFLINFHVPTHMFKGEAGRTGADFIDWMRTNIGDVGKSWLTDGHSVLLKDDRAATLFKLFWTQE